MNAHLHARGIQRNRMPLVLLYISQKPVMPKEAYNRAVTANQATYRRFQDVPREAFPLFLTSIGW